MPSEVFIIQVIFTFQSLPIRNYFPYKPIQTSKIAKNRTADVIRGTPCTTRGTPESIGDTPEITCGIPDIAGRTPVKKRGIPRAIRRTPANMRRIPASPAVPPMTSAVLLAPSAVSPVKSAIPPLTSGAFWRHPAYPRCNPLYAGLPGQYFS